jgi:uncharacterized damage-inducible protein DinB
MPSPDTWQSIVASSLNWDQAHATLDHSLEGLAPDQRGKQPEGFPHSVWQLVEHIRIAQHDLLDFCVNPKYTHAMKWPDDYWPIDPVPPSDAAWTASLAQIAKDREAFERFTSDGNRDLTAKIPHGTGQTYLRTVLVAVDHNAYHIGQIVDVRRLNGAWPPAKKS